MTWEIPTLILSGALVVLVATPLVVQGCLTWVLTGQFAWPTDLVDALVGIAHGEFGVGLRADVVRRLPGAEVMWALVVVGELLAFAGAVTLRLRLRDLIAGRRARHGLATPVQAAAALGVTRLRRSSRVVRPDHRLPRARGGGFGSSEVGWRLGRAGRTGPELWVPYDRTTCVIGPQGSGKTLDLLAPALLEAPGAAVVTLTKPDDLFLTLEARSRDGRPVAVLDPFGLAPGVPELVWDPVAGCEDAMLAERRAKAFGAGTVEGASAETGDQSARFYAGECAKVLQAYFHAAAIAGLGLDEVLTWVASPREHPQPEEILRTHPAAEPMWDGLLRGAINGDERTAANTITTVQQAMALFFQGSIRERCVPAAARPATGIRALIEAGGTIYLLGREDPYASASPLMTAVTEQILDAAKRLGETSPWGRLCPPFLACLDELPSTAPIPTLATRMANERALGLSFILAAQTWRQLVVCYGEDAARTIYGLSNNLVVFGGGKDIGFYRELSDLIGQTTTTETRYSRHGQGWFGVAEPSWERRRVPVLEPGELRRIGELRALVLAETHEPILAHLHRCIDGRRGRELLAAQAHARGRNSQEVK
ncbi:type IV secretory system conjugative DNA transfer family protein [Nocardioides sp. NPDC087217]|uniref:type IV secretory system conjugative DNA transfer family protein n=1 Tax=Nocardioides sp. NPDC087217 TaxID=3364335 RepID=UPI00381A7695